jgi:hypothetical protein
MDKVVYNVVGMRQDFLTIKESIRGAWLNLMIGRLGNFWGGGLENRIKELAAKIDNLTEEEMLNEIEAIQIQEAKQ